MKKNVVFLFADQWRRAAMECADMPDPVKTPNMAQFANENVYCTNGVSSCPLCSPYRASMLTGKYSFATGVFTNCKTELPIRLKDDEITLSDVLHDNGYHTAYAGKWHLDEPEARTHRFPESGANRGWDAYTPPGPGRHGFDEWLSYGAMNDHMNPHYWRDTTDRIDVANTWSAEYEIDFALDFMERHKDSEQPFALFVSWNPPHEPYDQVPDRYLEQVPEELPLRGNMMLEKVTGYTPSPDSNKQDYHDEAFMKTSMRQYFAAVQGLDEQFGRVVNYLKENDLLDNTYICLTSDHGDMMGSHGMIGKHVWYEESIGVPMVIGGGGLSSNRCETVIGTPDIAPTFLELLDLPVPHTMIGTSVAEQLVSGVDDEEKCTFLQSCPGLGIYLKKFEASKYSNVDFGWRGIRTKRYTLVAEVGFVPVEPVVCKYFLYDLENDPLQLEPIAVDFETNQLAADLQKKLYDFVVRENDGFAQFM